MCQAVVVASMENMFYAFATTGVIASQRCSCHTSSEKWSLSVNNKCSCSVVEMWCRQRCSVSYCQDLARLFTLGTCKEYKNANQICDFSAFQCKVCWINMKMYFNTRLSWHLGRVGKWVCIYSFPMPGSYITWINAVSLQLT